MQVKRGDVVIVNFSGSKPRPAVVIQNDKNNTRLVNTILVQVSSNTMLAGKEPTQVLVDVTTPDGQQSGLKHTSAVKCENIATQRLSDVHRVIGKLPNQLMRQVDSAIKASLDLK
jgi:mRNA interferase MazF